MLGIDAALDGVAANLQLRRQNRVQPLARGDRNCAFTMSTPVIASVMGAPPEHACSSR
jgi:hypothetical protein